MAIPEGGPVDAIHRHLWVATLSASGAEKGVLRILADRANSESLKCWPSVETISRESGYSIRQVQRALKSLANEKLIGVELSSGRKPNRYKLLFNRAMVSRLVIPNHDRVSRLEAPNHDRVSRQPRHGVTVNHDRVSPEPGKITRERTNNRSPNGDPAICERVFAYWQKLWEHPRARLDAKRKRAIKARLKDGYTEADLIRAIDGCKATPFNNGDNDRGQRYDGLTLILRDAEHVDRFIADADKPPGKPPTRPTRCVL